MTTPTKAFGKRSTINHLGPGGGGVVQNKKKIRSEGRRKKNNSVQGTLEKKITIGQFNCKKKLRFFFAFFL